MIADPKRPFAGRRLTVAEYHALIDAGALTEDDRVELIRGQLVPKMPIGDSHAACVDRLNRLFNRRTDDTVLVRSQNPVVLADSEPEPDLSLVRFRPDYYASGKPTPADTLLVIEVADTSLERDRDEKGPIYAENGIPEYWIVDLNSDTVLVHRGPRPDGAWGQVTTHSRGDTLTVAALPGVAVAVADLLP
jgi:Uma2 family endonuclease